MSGALDGGERQGTRAARDADGAIADLPVPKGFSGKRILAGPVKVQGHLFVANLHRRVRE